MSRPGPAISRHLWGQFFEDINQAADGGLYAELVKNRAFNENSTSIPGWSTLAQNATGSVSLDATQHAGAMARSLRMDVSNVNAGGSFGVVNGGYFGLKVVNGTTYTATVWAKSTTNSTLEVRLEDSSGTVLGRGTVNGVNGTWQKFTLPITASSGSGTGNRVVVAAQSAGTVWLQMVSLFPPTYKGRPNGLRTDLAEKVAALKPGLFRFPGGNFIEAANRATHWDWKKTVGDNIDRPGHFNSAWGYFSSDGLGIYEYLQYAEDIGAEPVLGIYAGLHLDGGNDILTESELAPYVQDALDALEYANGPTTSVWGAKRAAAGHPAPFNLKYLEIGNEDWLNNGASSYVQYRYRVFHDAIKARYPNVKLIATVRDSMNRTPDIIDDHYYLPTQTMLDFSHNYDNYPRTNTKIFVGEYASLGGTEPNRSASLAGAIGEAGFMTGLERNSDVVWGSAYAPLFQHLNNTQWEPDMIQFNAETSYVSPNYYVQQMFSSNTGTEVVPASFTSDVQNVFQSSSLNRQTGKLFVKVVNNNTVSKTLTLDLSSAAAVQASGSSIVLSSTNRAATNTLSQPNAIAPIAGSFTASKTFNYTFPANSVTVLTMNVTPGQIKLPLGETHSLKALTSNLSGNWYVRHQNQIGIISALDKTSSLLDKKEATFKLVAGLSDANCVSFEAFNHPGQYLRHFNYRIRLDANDNSQLFKDDATFCPEGGKIGRGLSFRAKNLDGYYLRHYDFALYMAKNGGASSWDTPNLFEEDTSFDLTAPLHRSLVDVPTGLSSLKAATPGLSNYFLRHRNNLGWVESITNSSAPTDRQDATFKVVQGLADNSCVSFESRNFPGQYLRHYDFRLRLETSNNSATFDDDATFCAVPGLSGNGLSFQSFNFPAYYLRHYNTEAWIAEKGNGAAGTTALFNEDASFTIEAPLAP
ncbi:AbfB domain-containing protein [Deinococcus hopiensis]|uniref:AbfB domain-containing protein n=1 Tax=Deinococcus hopiensis TaxID=309885 RepID=UPI0014832C7C|nr:AbfB domain-containing protein [Deinococcus hopiensis]